MRYDLEKRRLGCDNITSEFRFEREYEAILVILLHLTKKFNEDQWKDNIDKNRRPRGKNCGKNL